MKNHSHGTIMVLKIFRKNELVDQWPFLLSLVWNFSFFVMYHDFPLPWTIWLPYISHFSHHATKSPSQEPKERRFTIIKKILDHVTKKKLISFRALNSTVIQWAPIKEENKSSGNTDNVRLSTGTIALLFLKNKLT